jgi:ABC-type sugar transport system permease subunit
MFLAALDGVPRDLVESSRVDGASEWRVWRHVVVPSIRPTLTFVLVLLVIGASQVFTQVYITTGGGPFGSTAVLLTEAYQQAFSYFYFSYAAAIASLMAVVVLGLSILQIRVMRRNKNS